MQQALMRRRSPQLLILPFVLLLLCPAAAVHAQQQLLLNLASLDGAALSPDNILNFQVQSFSDKPQQARITGRVVYRSGGLSFSYTFPYTLRPGVNLPAQSGVHPQWSFSAQALRELFLDYKKLPQGTYEYCVEVVPEAPGGELIRDKSSSECLYFRPDELFLISLTEPEHKAKIHEYNPMLSWTVNYPFASALTYRVRVAEMKDGQNTTAAINRNNPVYQESNLSGMAVVYPVYARPLEKYQPYAWTVDAYYKGILLGGAEPWQFTIVEDSVLAAIPREVSYYDFKTHYGENYIYGIGTLKLKYVNNDDDNAFHAVINTGGDKKDLGTISLTLGDNRLTIPLQEKGLRHLKHYSLTLTDKQLKSFTIPFVYINPDFL